MKLSLNWIQDYVPDLPSVEDLVTLCCQAGLEIEHLTAYPSSVSGVFTGQIISLCAHPQADRLQIVDFFDGTTHHQIVTGATNIQVGNIVPASLPGAILADGTPIQSSVLRGISSHGMLCSEVELGIADSANGIWILPTNTPLGVDLAHYAQLSDTCLDFNILPNRPDCKTLTGLINELCAILAKPLFPTPHRIPSELAHTVRLLRMGETPSEWIWDKKQGEKTLILDPEHINALLGTSLTLEAMIKALTSLGFEYKKSYLNIPSWRQDIEDIPCLAEEIARLTGLNNIPATLPACFVPVDPLLPYQESIRHLELSFVKEGFQQLNTLPLVNGELHEHADAFFLKNPVSPQHAVLRRSLLSSMLPVIWHHHNHHVVPYALFEVGKVFVTPHDDPRLSESWECVAALYTPEQMDFQHLAGTIETILTTLPYSFCTHALKESFIDMHPKRSRGIYIGQTCVGFFGEISPLCTQYPQHVCLFFLDLSLVWTCPTTPSPSFVPYSLYPSVRRDVSMLIDSHISYDTIKTAIDCVKPDTLLSYTLFDVYQSDSLGKDQKSMAFAFVYQHNERSLSDVEIHTTHLNFLEKLSSQLSFQLR